MNTSLGSNKRGGASADSSAITRMRKLAAIASNYNQPSKQPRFPAGVVSVGLASSALQVFQNTTKGVAPPLPSGPSFSIVPIGLGDTTQTLNTLLPTLPPLPPWSGGYYAAYSFRAPATTMYRFTLTPTIQNEAVGQRILFVTSGTNIFTETQVLNASPPIELISTATISLPAEYELPATSGNTYYFATYGLLEVGSDTTPQTYTLNIAVG
uniref:Uncharacterized protein n=1 Tax=viral metagenome TaxID=1070528 RepID=A0A6C0I6H6_9ZZZZ